MPTPNQNTSIQPNIILLNVHIYYYNVSIIYIMVFFYFCNYTVSEYTSKFYISKF